MIKVAGYCRVSTDKDDQANSFETQKAYFREYIRRNPDWELYEIYADEGITGTTTKKRAQFNRMMNEAYEGKFRMIITKEVSRFSRNILDTISYTRELRAMGMGFRIEMDDFGTGYSNFHYLYHIDPQVIKIDRSFTLKALANDYEFNLLRHMVQLTHSINSKMCIEGIETHDELNKINELGPDFIQGYYFGKPCAYDAFVTDYVK